MQRTTIHLVLLLLSTAVSAVWGGEPIRAMLALLREAEAQVARRWEYSSVFPGSRTWCRARCTASSPGDAA